MIDGAFRMASSLVRALGGEPVRVGTLNPAKMGAVERALGSFADSSSPLTLVPVEVESGVSEQPIGWDGIRSGARNRARAAFESGPCVLAIGIEDGLVRLLDEDSRTSSDARLDHYNVGCAWLTDGEREGHGFSSAFSYPPECLEQAVRQQAPIGDLFDSLWRRSRLADPEPAKNAASGRSGGNIGRLTAGRLDRSAYGAQAILCGLVRFLHTDLYD